MQTRLVYYAGFVQYDPSLPSVVGGLPKHVPVDIPRSDMTGEELAFHMEVPSASVPGIFDDILAIQIYGPKDLEEPQRTPIVVPVSFGSKNNELGIGTECCSLRKCSIQWTPDVEPDIIGNEIPPTKKELQYYRTKIGGRRLFENKNCVPIGLLVEGDEGFNFGGSIVIWRQDDGVFRCELL